MCCVLSNCPTASRSVRPFTGDTGSSREHVATDGGYTNQALFRQSDLVSSQPSFTILRWTQSREENLSAQPPPACSVPALIRRWPVPTIAYASVSLAAAAWA